MAATVGVPRETAPGERRVALIPAQVAALVRAGLEVHVERNAGNAAGFPDEAYEEKGARAVERAGELFEKADILVFVQAPGAHPESAAVTERLRSEHTVIGLCDPLGTPEGAKAVAARGSTLCSLELIPRITRAQSMDVLSSMATLAGYKAVVLAADALPRIFPMLMTAAGTLAPARVFVVGVGVAGLQAIATARRLGGVVEAYDIRPTVKEQVESVGAKFVELALETGEAEGSGGYARAQDEEFYSRQRKLMTEVVGRNDVVITTAAVPGKKAPVLVTEAMVEAMAPGSVIVDLAAERGGNCALTRPGETVEAHGVTIIGPLNVPSALPFHASQMFSKNLTTYLLHLVEDGKLSLDRDDEIIRSTLVTRNGEVVHPVVREALDLPSTGAAIGSDA